MYNYLTMFFYDRKKSLGYLTGLASRLLSQTLGKRFQEAGIDMTAEQWGTLLILLDGDAMTQGQVGQKMCLEKSSMSRLANRLEQHGWIARTKVKGDSRQKQLLPTPQTLEVAERCASIATAVLEDAQRGMSQEERLACQSLLTRLIGNLGEPIVLGWRPER